MGGASPLPHIDGKSLATFVPCYHVATRLYIDLLRAAFTLDFCFSSTVSWAPRLRTFRVDTVV